MAFSEIEQVSKKINKENTKPYVFVLVYLYLMSYGSPKSRKGSSLDFFFSKTGEIASHKYMLFTKMWFVLLSCFISLFIE